MALPRLCSLKGIGLSLQEIVRMCDDVLSGAAGATVTANSLPMSAAFLQVSIQLSWVAWKALLALLSSYS